MSEETRDDPMDRDTGNDHREKEDRERENNEEPDPQASEADVENFDIVEADKYFQAILDQLTFVDEPQVDWTQFPELDIDPDEYDDEYLEGWEGVGEEEGNTK